MQDNSSSNKKASDSTSADNKKNETTPQKHNPFEKKNDTLSKEEEDGIEQFKEAQTERD